LSWLLHNISIRNKIFLINGIIILLTTGLLGYLILLLNENNRVIESQRTSLNKLELSQTAVRHFQSMKYWMSDLSVSWLNESEENTQLSYEKLKAALPPLGFRSKSELSELLAKLARFQQFGMDAVDAYVDENRVQCNAYTAKGRGLALEIEHQLDALLTQNNKLATAAGVKVSDSNQKMTQTRYIGGSGGISGQGAFSVIGHFGGETFAFGQCFPGTDEYRCRGFNPSIKSRRQ